MEKIEFTHPGAWMNMWACTNCGAIIEDRMADRHEQHHNQIATLQQTIEETTLEGEF